MKGTIRVLCLGNDLLADDAFGCVVADGLRELSLGGVDVVSTSSAGLNLLDDVQNVSHLLVVDTIQTGAAQPGTVFTLRKEDVRGVPGGSPHYVGLFEAIVLGRTLGMLVPEEVVILAVEPADCLIVGGAMHPAVQAAVPRVIDLIQQVVLQWQQCADGDLSLTRLPPIE